MAKAKARTKAEPPPKIELAHTGKDALERLKSLTSAVLAVPKAEIVAQEKQARKRPR